MTLMLYVVLSLGSKDSVDLAVLLQNCLKLTIIFYYSVVASLVYSVIKYRESVSNRSKPVTSEENTSTAPRK